MNYFNDRLSLMDVKLEMHIKNGIIIVIVSVDFLYGGLNVK